MATTWRSTLRRFPEPMPVLHHPHLCYYLRFVWLISLAFLLMEVAGVEGRVSSEGCLQRERDALLLFKAAIKDPSARLSSWRAQGDDCCAWTGVVCHNRTGSVRVAELNLGNPNVDQSNWKEYSLRGELLHPSLLSLSHLQRLNLSFNDFEATQIPPLVGSLHKLMYLDLYHSNIGGTFPPHLGNLTNLRSLFLGLNSAKVVHSLDWFSGLSSLIYLDMSALDLSAVSHNWFSAVNMLPSLQVLYLYDCKINNIPLSLSFHLNLTSLVDLNLGFNNFNSSFPNWLWNLTSLSFLVLFNSGIQGTLPTEIGNLIDLTYLDLSSNLLSGPFPDVIMNLSSLSTLCLYNCSLSGPIPSELGNMTTLNNIYLQHNSLSGPIPIEIWKLVNLNDLDLSSNSFEGEITEFHHSNLTFLDLSYNKISDEIPKELGYLVGLQNLNLSRNYFRGKIPDNIGGMSSMETLDLSFNNLTGVIPQSLSKLNALNHLNLSFNNLSGFLFITPKLGIGGNKEMLRP
ncbi:hypothetical protein ZIOFF_049336 [Zingiber officinale]|uniref:Leucine-rich repeat-containing N-terminal plant-type domain-containing protein n=1 Tax=Zingiber officinale TaxID=94328 RepID=A0A8J5KT73_ZINOF|nr:hypothetical protein ZIOFF_049336 [Zingiber officinale]